MRKWLPMIILASAQFVMVLDSSVMNVAISQIVDDLDTTIQGVQTAITLYTLVMAAFMLLGAKLGDILGRNRAFAIGLAIYGVGSLTTALSPNLAVLLVGWSGIEGFGAVLVVPAIAALTAANYEGRERALAYALLGGVAAIAVAAGPLIGGWVTTEYTWRYVFAAETVVVIVILLLRGRIAPAPAAARRPQLDIVGVVLSSAGLGLIVFAILRSSVWGFVQPRTPPDDQRHRDHAAGLLGCAVPRARWSRAALGVRRVGGASRPSGPGPAARYGPAGHQAAAGGALDAGRAAARPDGHVLRDPRVPAGGGGARRVRDRQAPASAVGRDARVRAAGAADRGQRSPRVVAQIGLVAVSLGALVMLGTLDVELNDPGFKVALGFIGAGAGLLASQLGNVIMSSVAPTQTSEAGGLQGTAQNLGASLGTALVGAVLLAPLATGFSERIIDNPAVPEAARETIVANADQGIDIVPVDDVEDAAVEGGLTPDQASAVAADYGDAQLDALRLSLGAVALAALLSLWLTRRPADPDRSRRMRPARPPRPRIAT